MNIEATSGTAGGCIHISCPRCTGRLITMSRGGAPVSLWPGSGYMFEYERLELPDTASHPRTASVHRWSSYLTSRLSAGARTTVVATVYGQPRFDEIADFRILSDVSLAVSITRTLSLSISFELRYDSRPPDDVVSLDTQLTNGISVGF